MKAETLQQGTAAGLWKENDMNDRIEEFNQILQMEIIFEVQSFSWGPEQ